MKQAQVEAEDIHVCQLGRDFVGDDALGDALHQGGLAHSRVTNDDRVVLAPAGQDVDALADLRLTSDHGVQLSDPGLGRVVEGEAAQGRLGPAAMRTRGDCGDL